MSWQAYVDQSLVGTGHVDKAAIISIAGDSTWASTAGFTLSATEMKVVADIVKGDKNVSDKAFADGLFIGGERYVMARAEEGAIYARKGKEGIAVAKSTQAVLLGHHGENQQAGNATQAVQKLADYLVSMSY